MITLTKTKRFVMGALVRALFVRNINKTNNKQHVNRGYDSESGTTIQSRLVRFARCNPDGHEGEPVKTRCNAVTCCWKKGS
ncbi:hypothetical protein R302_08215 [Salmonella enterica]|nr:hypothetical protein [Salmonella enterica subsp. arizonae serovar 63:z4,z23:-]EAY4648860.1 hypothetical protein [Salmonella enterica]EDX9624193.1 hypothetical protein [Salmonella enterica]